MTYIRKHEINIFSYMVMCPDLVLGRIWKSHGGEGVSILWKFTVACI